MIAPVLTYTVLPGEQDVHAVYVALSELADEDPMLGVNWNTHLEQIICSLWERCSWRWSSVCLPTLLALRSALRRAAFSIKRRLPRRLRCGHFEPLRHYAEVHLRLEPLSAGSGVEFGTVTSTDELDLNWQRLALTNAMEREHLACSRARP